MREENSGEILGTEGDDDGYVILPISEDSKQKSPKINAQAEESRVNIGQNIPASEATRSPKPTSKANPCAFFTNHKAGIGIATAGLAAAVTVGLSCI